MSEVEQARAVLRAHVCRIEDNAEIEAMRLHNRAEHDRLLAAFEAAVRAEERAHWAQWLRARAMRFAITEALSMARLMEAAKTLDGGAET